MDLMMAGFSFKKSRIFNLDLKKKILLNIFPIVLVVIAVMLVVKHDLSNNSKDLQRALAFKAKVETLLPSAIIQDDSSKAMLLNPELLGEFSEVKIEAYDRNLAILKEIEEQSQDARIIALLKELNQLDQDQLSPLDSEILELLFSDQQEAVKKYFSEYSPLRKEYRKKLRQIVVLANDEVDVAQTEFAEKNSNTTLLLALLLGGGGLVASFLLYLTSGIVSKRLVNSMSILGQESSRFERVTAQIDSTTANLLKQSQSSRDQGANAIEIIRDMELKTEQLIDRSNQCQGSVAELKKTTHDAVEHLSKLKDYNENLLSDFKGLESLSQLIQEIGSKVAQIEQIVMKTTLLSVNASIEAAKAGETGRGFAIVAQEVGQLASISGEVSQSIQNLLHSSQGKTDQLLSVARSSLSKEANALNQMMNDMKSVFDQFDRLVEDVQKIGDQVDIQAGAQRDLSHFLTDIMNQVTSTSESIQNYTEVTMQVGDSKKGIKYAESILIAEVYGHRAASEEEAQMKKSA